jgi:hypothetical protein
MTAQQHNLHSNLHPGPGPQAAGKFFGIPLGDLGFFSSVLMAFTLGFMSFFLFTFLGIVSIMIYNGTGHQVDYAASYKYIALPVGCIVLAISLVFFGTLWLRRKLAGR